jgi:hypothetical protein
MSLIWSKRVSPVSLQSIETWPLRKASAPSQHVMSGSETYLQKGQREGSAAHSLGIPVPNTSGLPFKTLPHQMTRHPMPRRRLDYPRLLLAADGHGVRAAGVEAAAGGRMQRAGHVAGEALA